jgi:hypothetical protein
MQCWASAAQKTWFKIPKPFKQEEAIEHFITSLLTRFLNIFTLSEPARPFRVIIYLVRVSNITLIAKPIAQFPGRILDPASSSPKKRNSLLEKRKTTMVIVFFCFLCSVIDKAEYKNMSNGWVMLFGFLCSKIIVTFIQG